MPVEYPVRVPYRTQSPDTTREAEEVLFAAYRRLSASEKLERVGALGRMLKSVVWAELRARHPAADERELRLRYAARLFDVETMQSVFGWPPEESKGG
jgi:hypothetical protein